MNVWMNARPHIAPLGGDVERVLDAWGDGGVDGIVIGPLMSPARIALYEPDPAVYRRFGVEPPPAPTTPQTEARAEVDRILAAAERRGWTIIIMSADSGAGPGATGRARPDPAAVPARAARMVDAFQHFPMAQGAIVDSLEWGYEIDPRHGGFRSSPRTFRQYIFHELPESVAPLCAEYGCDYEALVAAKDRLYRRLRTITPREVRLHAGGGLAGAFALFGYDTDLMAWLRFRAQTVTDYFKRLRQALDGTLERRVRIGAGLRSAAFAPVTGGDFAQLAETVDFLCPKHYFWQRGFDGMYGTVYRYVLTLRQWNPALAEQDALAIVEALFGLRLPEVESSDDLDSPHPQAFFDTIVRRETRRALAVVDDAERIVPWVDAGRKPHDGEPFGAGDLRRTLRAAQDEGLRRFICVDHANLTASEWAVISAIAGRPWKPAEGGYEPPDIAVL
jgi:hypothetical protein